VIVACLGLHDCLSEHVCGNIPILFFRFAPAQHGSGKLISLRHSRDSLPVLDFHLAHIKFRMSILFSSRQVASSTFSDAAVMIAPTCGHKAEQLVLGWEA